MPQKAILIPQKKKFTECGVSLWLSLRGHMSKAYPLFLSFNTPNEGNMPRIVLKMSHRMNDCRIIILLAPLCKCKLLLQ